MMNKNRQFIFLNLSINPLSNSNHQQHSQQRDSMGSLKNKFMQKDIPDKQTPQFIKKITPINLKLQQLIEQFDKNQQLYKQKNKGLNNIYSIRNRDSRFKRVKQTTMQQKSQCSRPGIIQGTKLMFSLKISDDQKKQEFYNIFNPFNSAPQSKQIFKFEDFDSKINRTSLNFKEHFKQYPCNFRLNITKHPPRSSEQFSKKQIPNLIKNNVKKKIKLTPNPKQYPLDRFVQSQVFSRISSRYDINQQNLNLKSQSITILHQNCLLYEMNSNQSRQIASLTKIMTCILSLYLSKKYSINLKSYIKVSKNASQLPGTSAELKTGDKLTILDALYGMMLPSGNDAALCLAQYFGKIIYKHSEEIRQRKQQYLKHLNKKVQYFTDLQERIVEISKSEQNVAYFIKQMNHFSRYLKLENTSFSNPHGLSDHKNRSSSNDLAYLCYYAIKNPIFKQIVKTVQYKCDVFNKNQKLKRQLKWVNTNKLLQLDYCQGIKTGMTNTAGPCLASCFKKQKFEPIIVILKTSSGINRFKQMQLLFNWSYEKFSNMNLPSQTQK